MLDGSHGGGAVDIVGSVESPGVEWQADDNTLWLRIRLDGSAESAPGVWLPQTWGFLVEQDGDLASIDRVIDLNGATGVIEVWDAAGAPLGALGSAVNGDARATSDGTPRVEFALDRTLLAGLGVTNLATTRIVAITGSDPFTDRHDHGGCGAVCTPITTVWSDPLVPDRDADGLPDAVEGPLGSSPDDADSDDDGVPDRFDVRGDPDGDGTSGLMDCDADNDGLADGVEAGVTEPARGTAPNVCFRADADPTTTSDPARADTDGGGLDDGWEDLDHDGRLDAWESDPNTPVDDPDADRDGLADVVETPGTDVDGDGLLPVNDTDSDGDGLPDHDERTRDSDGDGKPDFLDTDSDNDGITDRSEGAEDGDGDGAPDYRDTDSDNDGAPDAVEGLDDVDCDGLPDAVDPDDRDGDCDSDDRPAVDTDFDADLDSDADTSTPHFTGGACATSPGSGLLAIAIALLAVRRRSLALVLFASAPAAAQEVDADRFRPLGPGRLVAVRDPTIDERDGASLWADVANTPLAVRSDSGVVEVLGSLVTARAQAFAAGRRGWVQADVPVHLVRSGFGPAIGDARLEGLAAFAHGRRSLGFGLDVSIPTGAAEGYTGARRTTLGTTLAGGLGAGPVDVIGNLGLRTGTADHLGALTLGPSLRYGLGAEVKLTGVLRVGVEATGEAWLGNPDEPGAFALEALAFERLETRGPWSFLVGAGPGLSPGFGVPSTRVFVGLTWRPDGEPTPEVQRSASGRRTSPSYGATGPGRVTVALSGSYASWVEVRAADGVIAWMAPSEPPKAAFDLPEGHYTIAVGGPGCKESTREVDAHAGVDTVVALYLPCDR